MSLAALLDAEFVLPNFDHQLVEFEGNCDTPKRALAWTMRTGKTKAAIDKACHLYLKRNKIDGVLIFAPNGVHANWAEVEFPKHCWTRAKHDALVWRSSELSTRRADHVRVAERAQFAADRKSWFERLKRAKHTSNLMVLAVPTESMTRPDVRKAVAFFAAKRRVLVIFDESDDFGTPGSKRVKMARALARRCPYALILSGTMLTATPLAAFSQFELLEKEALGFARFDDFKEHFATFELAPGKGGRKYPKLTGFQNEDELRERMARFCSVVDRDDVKDMPELFFETRPVVPTDEQRRVYRELHNSIMAEIDGVEVSIGELAPRLQKLQQVFSGFLKDEFGDVHVIPGGNPRLNLLLHEAHVCPGKFVVWCQFHEDIDNVAAALRLDGHGIVEYHGRVTDADKKKALVAFRDDRKVRGLVGHMKAGGRGLDMSAASRILCYSHTFSARARAQAMERATKIGGGNILVVDFVAPGPDQYILNVTEGRVRVADSLIGSGMKKLLRSMAL